MKKVFKRFARATVSILIAGSLAYFKSDPKYLILAPLIQSAGKWLRLKIGGVPIPF